MESQRTPPPSVRQDQHYLTITQNQDTSNVRVVRHRRYYIDDGDVIFKVCSHACILPFSIW